MNLSSSSVVAGRPLPRARRGTPRRACARSEPRSRRAEAPPGLRSARLGRRRGFGRSGGWAFDLVPTKPGPDRPADTGMRHPIGTDTRGGGAGRSRGSAVAFCVATLLPPPACLSSVGAGLQVITRPSPRMVRRLAGWFDDGRSRTLISIPDRLRRLVERNRRGARRQPAVAVQPERWSRRLGAHANLLTAFPDEIDRDRVRELVLDSSRHGRGSLAGFITTQIWASGTTGYGMPLSGSPGAVMSASTPSGSSSQSDGLPHYGCARRGLR